MAIDPSISLAAHPPAVRSPMDSLQKAVSIADMAALTAERVQIAKQRAQEAPYRQAELEAKRKKIDEDNTLDEAFNQSAKLNPDTGDIDYDTKKATEVFTSRNMGHLLPRYQSEIDTRRTQHRTEVLNEAKAFLQRTDQEGQIAESFLEEPDEAKRAENYLVLRRSLVQLDPKVAASLPQKYDESVAKTLQGVVSQRDSVRTTAEKLEAAQQKQVLKAMEDLKLSPEQLWDKQNPGVPMPAWFRNSITAKRSGVTAPSASMYQDKKLTTMNGNNVPADAEDRDGNPIPTAQRTQDSILEQRQDSNGRVYYQITKDERQTDKQRDQELAENGYAFSLGKKPSDLTPEDKVKAVAWRKKLDPAKATEFDKRLELYQKDPQTYGALYGHGVEKAITPAQKATILGRINTAIARQFLAGDEAKAYRDERFAELKEAGVDMGGTPGANGPPPTLKPAPGKEAIIDEALIKKIMDGNAGETRAGAITALRNSGWRMPNDPKDGTPVYKKGTTEILGYFDGFGSDGKVKTRATQAKPK